MRPRSLRRLVFPTVVVAVLILIVYRLTTSHSYVSNIVRSAVSDIGGVLPLDAVVVRTDHDGWLLDPTYYSEIRLAHSTGPQFVKSCENALDAQSRRHRKGLFTAGFMEKTPSWWPPHASSRCDFEKTDGSATVVVVAGDEPDKVYVAVLRL